MTEQVKLLLGDCLESLKQLEDNSVDSVVTDPPYGLSFMGKAWDYDVPKKEVWQECLRVLKPGGYLLSFSSSRTYHRMAVAVEDAGFEIRDQIMWVYGSGFPKSYNVGKNMDKFLKTGNASWNGTGDSSNGGLGYTKSQVEHGYRPDDYTGRHQNKEHITHPDALKWQGWGTGLKPAHEPIVLARKPISEKNIASNVLKWGTGAINIDDCRVSYDNDGNDPATNPLFRYQNDYAQVTDHGQKVGVNVKFTNSLNPPNEQGRFPANFIHDGSEEVLELFPEVKGGTWTNTKGARVFNNDGKPTEHITLGSDQSVGSAARFFYCPKTNKKDRGEGNHHPTVKPTDLMAYLCRLVTQPGGVVLDPYMGSGSTGKAAVREGFRFIGCEMSEEYLEISRQRLEEEPIQRPDKKPVGFKSTQSTLDNFFS